MQYKYWAAVHAAMEILDSRNGNPPTKDEFVAFRCNSRPFVDGLLAWTEAEAASWIKSILVKAQNEALAHVSDGLAQHGNQNNQWHKVSLHLATCITGIRYIRQAQNACLLAYHLAIFKHIKAEIEAHAAARQAQFAQQQYSTGQAYMAGLCQQSAHRYPSNLHPVPAQSFQTGADYYTTRPNSFQTYLPGHPTNFNLPMTPHYSPVPRFSARDIPPPRRPIYQNDSRSKEAPREMPVEINKPGRRVRPIRLFLLCVDMLDDGGGRPEL